ncbi:hypothetical protein DSLASN_09740 [Desulfoluna limicola]|uniref:DUF4037 domain-containing protein n=1 Tax=Desulfoluna limicola TaxID=2810562 RepID=A0ABN6F1M7_9BACT|nr:DUF4125 family protein [Desulfoluna limicola]BCS95342.1 hypothetical protein DSLASN_09740 [Desulfoluna limicola]
MNGLELSESYYNGCGKEIFEGTFKALMERVAIGLVGPGSECFGFDDEYSRDHDWGPSFCLWVTQDDFQRYGKELQACYDALPKEYSGFGPRVVSPGEKGRVGVMEISDFYGRYTGLTATPNTIKEWNIPSENLALCTNGKVFSDPLGAFSQWRTTLLHFYPEDLRLKKIADCCMQAGQAGQYNWQRGILRNDPYVTNTAKVKFCTEIMRLVYLLNRTYAPFYKWLLKGVAQLPILGAEVAPLIVKVLTGPDETTSGGTGWKEQQDTMERICQTVIAELQGLGLTDRTVPFLTDHVPSILGRIKDQDFRKNLWGAKKSLPEKKEIIKKILEGEWEMFSTVNDKADSDPLAQGGPTCRDFPEEFKLHRTAKLMAWSEKTLISYLDDINEAQNIRRNLMTYKYARMDNLIPSENNSPYIDKISKIQLQWQREFIEKYPRIMSGGRALSGGEPGTDWASFETYMRCELESYSEKTLQSLFQDIESLRVSGKSMSEEIYKVVVQQKGYKSLEEAENKQTRLL